MLAEHVRPKAVALAFQHAERRVDPVDGVARSLNEYREQGRFQIVAEAVYDLVVHQEVSYETEPPTAKHGTQRIRGPREITSRAGRRGVATCIDLAVSFSAAAMDAGLWPLIVRFDGHALVLVSLTQAYHDHQVGLPDHAVALDDPTCRAVGHTYELVARLIKSKELLAIETTAATVSSDPSRIEHGNDRGQLPFESAVELGTDLVVAGQPDFTFVLDPVVAQLFHHIEPYEDDEALVTRTLCARMPPVPSTPIEQVVRQIDERAAAGRVLLVGPGGSGKSTAASLFAHRQFEAGRCDVAWWVDASSEDLLIRDLAEFAEVTEGPEAPDETLSRARAALRALTAGGHRFLVVYDNATSRDVLRRWLPAGSAGVLVTTRDGGWRGDDLIGSVIDVEPWTEAAALDYLGAAPPSDQRDRAALQQILQRTGGLPLALSGVRAQKRKPGRRWRDVLHALNERGTIAEMDDLTSLFETSLHDALNESEHAAELLGVLAFMYTQDLPLDRIARRLAEVTDVSESSWDRARWALIDNAFLRLGATETADAPDGERATMHALRAEFARERLPRGLHLAGALLSALADDADGADGVPDRQFVRIWHPHTVTVLEHLVVHAPTDAQLAASVLDASTTLAGVEADAGEHLLSYETCSTAMSVVEQFPTVREIDRGAAINAVFQYSISSILQGSFDEGSARLATLIADDEAEITGIDLIFEPIVRSALLLIQVMTQYPGPMLGEAAETLGFIERIEATSFGADEEVGGLMAMIRTLILEQACPIIHTLQGDAEKALAMLADVPAIDTVDPKDAADLPFVRLAEAHLALGNADQCIHISRRFEAALLRNGEPPTNLDLLEIRGFLGSALAATGSADAAIELLEANLERFAQHSMDRGVDFAEQTGFLGAALLAAGRPSDAITRLDASLDLFRQLTVPDHPYVLQVRRVLASALAAAGRPGDAVVELDHVVDGYIRQRGPEHPSVAAATAARDQLIAERDRPS